MAFRRPVTRAIPSPTSSTWETSWVSTTALRVSSLPARMRAMLCASMVSDMCGFTSMRCVSVCGVNGQSVSCAARSCA